MKIKNVRHKGLRRLIEADDRSGVPAGTADKLIDQVAFLNDMEAAEELRALRSWKAHQLTGNRKGTWSLHVTKNWRLTFATDNGELEIIDLDFEDYH